MKRRVLKVIVVSMALVLLFALAATGQNITIQEWKLPTPDSFPHDPAVAPDGSLWYTGMASNTLGRLDPKTGEIKEYRLGIPESGPHGLVSDKSGNIWFTAIFKGYIGKLDPKTGEITEYSMPDRAARDPHTPVFDNAGILWFTVQQGNFVGRLDPGTGSIRLQRSPTPDSRPYGIVIDAGGVPFFCEFGTNKIGMIDPSSMKIIEFILPEGARPRRLAVGAKNIIFYSDYQRGYLGMLDPSTGKVQEWASPGGKESRPYGIATTADGSVWYAETGVKPNRIVRFHPDTMKFEISDVGSGGGVIRNMAATPDGDVFIACSGVNTVGIVRAER